MYVFTFIRLGITFEKKKKEKKPTMSDEQLLSHASPQHVMP